MTVPVTGIAPESSSVSVQSIYNAAVHFCIANQFKDTLIEMCGKSKFLSLIYLLMVNYLIKCFNSFLLSVP